MTCGIQKPFNLLDTYKRRIDYCRHGLFKDLILLESFVLIFSVPLLFFIEQESLLSTIWFSAFFQCFHDFTIYSELIFPVEISLSGTSIAQDGAKPE